MPIVSVGTDLTRIDRLEVAFAKRGARLLERLFTPGERAYCDARPRTRFTHYAGRFAAKEAVMKVLGTGWRRGVRWVDIEVRRAPGAAPTIVLHGASAALAASRGIARLHLSITHDAGLAAATVVAEGP